VTIIIIIIIIIICADGKEFFELLDVVDERGEG